jgi:monoamine oxidase
MAQTANNLGFAQQNKELFDVIIVGAGVSGSTAAYTLKKQCSSLKILVIEAKNRVGGRTQTVELNCSKPGKKIKVDAGGQWVSDTQETITPLLKELNIETFPQFDTGKKQVIILWGIIKFVKLSLKKDLDE